jgi:4-diphosphocytidyl-2-C-methyl-D-erythritol kinase
MNIRIKAHAKINLSLEILGRRSDGYHNLISVMQTVGLFDDLDFSTTKTTSLIINSELKPELYKSVLTAANALREETSMNLGATITLKKNIPIASGLGGASTDAAAVLIGLNKLWRLNLSSQELMDIGLKIGSDVPFFIQSNGIAIVQGKGNEIDPIVSKINGYALILTPINRAKGMKTKGMFKKLKDSDFTDGKKTMQLVSHLNKNTNITEIMKNNLGINGFDDLITTDVDLLDTVNLIFKDGTSRRWSFTGTGPSIYSLYNSVIDARLKADTIPTDIFIVNIAPFVNSPIQVISENHD